MYADAEFDGGNEMLPGPLNVCQSALTRRNPSFARDGDVHA
jgi:hypothetical protein